MSIALPARRPLAPHPGAEHDLPRPVVVSDHPHGDASLGSAPAAPLAVVLIGMLVVASGLLTGAVLLVVHLLRVLVV